MTRAGVVRQYGGVSADRRRADRRRRLLDAARQAWGAQGAAEVTVRGVCAAAGLTPRYFYEHFDSRDTLLLAVADEVMSQLTGTLLAASQAEPGGIGAKLRAALVAFFEAISGDPHIHRVLTSDPASVPGLARHQELATARVVDLVIEQSSLLLDPVPPEQDLRRGALFAVGGINGLVVDWLADPVASPQEMAVLCTRLSLAVISGAPRRPDVVPAGSPGATA